MGFVAEAEQAVFEAAGLEDGVAGVEGVVFVEWSFRAFIEE
ncbi:MAG: hypothetical protein AAGH99_14480 [Planctomycetota bacterium]